MNYNSPNERYWFEYNDDEFYDIIANYTKNRDLIGKCLNETDQFGNTKLFYLNTPHVIQLYLESGANVNHTNFENENALFRAGFDKALTLLNWGIDTTVVNHFGRNALFEADYDTLQLLFERGANIHQKDQNDANLFFHYKDLDRLKFLVANNVVSEVDYSGQTALFDLSQDYESILYLIDNDIININAIDKEGHNLLYYNHSELKSDIIRHIINKGINIYDEKLFDGVSASDYYFSKKNPEIASLILEKISIKEKEIISNNICNLSSTNKVKQRI